MTTQGLTHGDRCIDLYARVNRGAYKRANNAEKDSKQERDLKECTGIPAINGFEALNARPDQTLEEIKGVDLKLV